MWVRFADVLQSNTRFTVAARNVNNWRNRIKICHLVKGDTKGYPSTVLAVRAVCNNLDTHLIGLNQLLLPKGRCNEDKGFRDSQAKDSNHNPRY